jgi:hypothetical protein
MSRAPVRLHEPTKELLMDGTTRNWEDTFSLRIFVPTHGLCSRVGGLLLVAALSSSALGQDVTLADLEGVVIEARFLRQQTFIREGRERTNQVQNDVHIEIGFAGNIQQTVSPTAYTANGARKGKTTSGAWIIEQPRELASRGGGHGVWIFADRALTFLRTFKGGALKRIFAFARGADGLHCTGTETFAYEQGVHGIHLDSGINGMPIVILSTKPISATCRIKTTTPQSSNDRAGSPGVAPQYQGHDRGQ